MQAVPAVISLVGQLHLMDALQTLLAGATAHLFDDTLVPDETTPLTSFTTAEVAYTGYADRPITAWLDPIVSPLGGVTIRSTQLQWSLATTPIATATAAGFWIQDSAMTPNLIGFAIFPTVVPFTGPGDGVSFTALLNAFGGGFSINIDDD